MKDTEEGANAGITKARLLIGTKAEWTPSPLVFSGPQLFRIRKTVSVRDG